MTCQPSDATLGALIEAMGAADLKIDASIKRLDALREGERLLALAALLCALADRRALLRHGLDALASPSLRPSEA